MKGHLVGKLLPFWMALRDEEKGGFYGFMDSNLTLQKDAVKGCILNNRILWFFSNASLALKDEGLKEFEMTLGELTDDEREIILKGCLINYNRQ